MAVQSFTCAPDNTNVTTFRAWIQAIHNALNAYGGLVQTADTGQINIAAAAVPAAGSSAGYEIYRFNDSLQATSPVFLKIEYGTSSSLATGPQIWVTLGTATDGAGTLSSVAGTGVSVTTRTSLTGSPTALDATARQCYVNGDASTLVLALWNQPAAGAACCLLIVERNRDTSGNPTGDGVQIIWANSVASAAVQTILMHTQVAQTGSSTSYSPTVTPQGAASSGIKDSVMSVYPIMTGGGPKLGAPSKFIVAHNAVDLAPAGVFSNTHYGSVHNWVSWSAPRSSGIWSAAAVRTD